MGVEKVLAILMGGGTNIFEVVLSHTDGGAKGFHLLKGGGGGVVAQNVLPCLKVRQHLSGAVSRNSRFMAI